MYKSHTHTSAQHTWPCCHPPTHPPTTPRRQQLPHPQHAVLCCAMLLQAGTLGSPWGSGRSWRTSTRRVDGRIQSTRHHAPCALRPAPCALHHLILCSHTEPTNCLPPFTHIRAITGPGFLSCLLCVCLCSCVRHGRALSAPASLQPHSSWGSPATPTCCAPVWRDVPRPSRPPFPWPGVLFRNCPSRRRRAARGWQTW